MPYIRNRYLIAFVSLAVWLIFFDRNDLISQYRMGKKVKGLESEKQYFTGEILKNQQDLKDLRTNQKSLEKFAREKYLMKRDNEDIFVLVEDSLK